jgi:hypothetical protein
MNPRCLFNLVAAFTICAGFIQSANAQGVIGGFVDRIVPGAGPALDSWSRQAQERSSSEGVGAQILKGRPDDVPFRSAPGAGPASSSASVGNKCAFPTGGFGYIPASPIGTPCSFMSPMGQMSGTVM